MSISTYDLSVLCSKSRDDSYEDRFQMPDMDMDFNRNPKETILKITMVSNLYLSEDDSEELFDNFSFVSSIRFFLRNRSCRCDSIDQKIVEIASILAIFRLFEDFSLRSEIFEIQII